MRDIAEQARGRGRGAKYKHEPAHVSRTNILGDRTKDQQQGNRSKKSRKAGAPAGNQNALKHGFYSRLFTGDERHRLEENGDRYQLDAEIDLLRVCIDRLAEQLQFTKETYTIMGKDGSETEMPDDYNLKALNTFAGLQNSLATLIRTHYLTKGKGGALEGGILEALEELRLEMGIT